MVVIHCYLERNKDEVLKCYMSYSSYFEISASLFYVPPSYKHSIFFKTLLFSVSYAHVDTWQGFPLPAARGAERVKEQSVLLIIWLCTKVAFMQVAFRKEKLRETQDLKSF